VGGGGCLKAEIFLRVCFEDLIFVRGDVDESIMADGVDLHFVKDIDGVAVVAVRRRFEDDFEPGGVGATFLIEDDGADGVEGDGFAGAGVDAFIVVDAVVFAEEKGDDGGFFYEGRVGIYPIIQVIFDNLM
jgi:hypothetical protein